MLLKAAIVYGQAYIQLRAMYILSKLHGPYLTAQISTVESGVGTLANPCRLSGLTRADRRQGQAPFFPSASPAVTLFPSLSRCTRIPGVFSLQRFILSEVRFWFFLNRSQILSSRGITC
jgi:hypothetical protein